MLRVLKDRKMVSLYVFFIVYFFSIGITTYSGRFYGEIGLNDSQIGLIAALSAFVSLFAQPVWGTLSDRVKFKKRILIVALLCAAGLALLVQPVSGSFLPLLAVMVVMNTFILPVLPISNAIALEYTRDHGHDFGPVRLMGTLGYQAIILVSGFIFATSLNGLYNGYALLLVLSAIMALTLPPVQGHQHGKQKANFTVFFKDKNLVLLFALGFIAHMSSQFYLTFFSKHLGELGISNTVTGIITTLSVSLEIPFLIFGDKLLRRMSIWKWMWLGLIINGLRMIALSVVTSPALIVATQIFSVAQLGCFEFFPAIYLSRAVAPELRGSAQSTYNLLSGCTSRIIGSLVGGFVAQATSIGSMFAINGSLLLIAAVTLTVPLLRLAKKDNMDY